MVALNKENNGTEEIEERVDKKQKFRQVDRQVLKNITQSVLSTNFHVHDIINNHYDSFIFKNQAKRSGNTNDIKTPVVWGGTLCGNKKHDDLNKETKQGNTLGADFFYNDNRLLGVSSSSIVSNYGHLDDKKIRI